MAKESAVHPSRRNRRKRDREAPAQRRLRRSEPGERQAHIDELAALGVPGPKVTPTMYPVAPYLAQQTDTVLVQHSRTSGEVE
jgi:hypothetical protein